MIVKLSLHVKTALRLYSRQAVMHVKSRTHVTPVELGIAAAVYVKPGAHVLFLVFGMFVACLLLLICLLCDTLEHSVFLVTTSIVSLYVFCMKWSGARLRRYLYRPLFPVHRFFFFTLNLSNYLAPITLLPLCPWAWPLILVSNKILLFYV